MTCNELEREKIKELLQRFFDGFDNLDGEVIKKVFHPKAFLFDSSREGLEGFPIVAFCDMFLPMVKNDPNHLWNKEKSRKNVVLIDITGDAASAKVEWIFSNLKYTDYYTLLNIDDEWYIINKTWVAENI